MNSTISKTENCYKSNVSSLVKAIKGGGVVDIVESEESVESVEKVERVQLLIRKLELLEHENQFLQKQIFENEKEKSIQNSPILKLSKFEYLKWIEEQVPIKEGTQTTKYTICLETGVYVMLKLFQKLTNLSTKEIISEALFLFIKANCFESGNKDLLENVFIDSKPLLGYKKN